MSQPLLKSQTQVKKEPVEPENLLTQLTDE